MSRGAAQAPMRADVKNETTKALVGSSTSEEEEEMEGGEAPPRK